MRGKLEHNGTTTEQEAICRPIGEILLDGLETTIQRPPLLAPLSAGQIKQNPNHVRHDGYAQVQG